MKRYRISKKEISGNEIDTLLGLPNNTISITKENDEISFSYPDNVTLTTTQKTAIKQFLSRRLFAPTEFDEKEG